MVDRNHQKLGVEEMRFLKSFGAAVGYLAIYAIVIIIVTVAECHSIP
jgi:hypothetical protein